MRTGPDKTLHVLSDQIMPLKEISWDIYIKAVSCAQLSLASVAQRKVWGGISAGRFLKNMITENVHQA